METSIYQYFFNFHDCTLRFVKKNIYQQKLFVPAGTILVRTFTGYILNWLCFADLSAMLSLK